MAGQEGENRVYGRPHPGLRSSPSVGLENERLRRSHQCFGSSRKHHRALSVSLVVIAMIRRADDVTPSVGAKESEGALKQGGNLAYA
jgi:hypothetical protein